MLKQALDPCSIVRVQTWDSQPAAPSTIEPALGVVWPHQTGMVASGRADIICIGPADWLVVATDPDAAALLRRLEDAFEGSTFRATNVSHALARIEIDGPETRDLLSRGCGLDLHPSCFPPGRCVRTRFAGMPVIVRCMRNSNFQCLVTRSLSDYFLSWLKDAGLAFVDTP